MNRAEKRRQRKRTGRAAGKSNPVQVKTFSAEDAIDAAMRHHMQGRLSEAGNIYRQILQADPAQPIALHLLGVLAHQAGDNGVAIDLITKALAIEPDYAEAHNNLGNAHKAMGRLDKSVDNFHQALVIKPDYIQARYNLGNALQELGRLDEALDCYHQFLAVDPGFAEAHNNLGNALKALGRPDEAVSSYREALAIKPDYAQAYNNLGNALSVLGANDAAMASYLRALAIKPDFAEAQNHLGNALLDQGTPDEAVASYRKALAIVPDYVDAHNNLGNALKRLGRLDEAAASYRAALRLDPAFADAHYNLHALLLDPEDMAPAIECMEKAVEFDPGRLHYRFILGMLQDYAGNSREAEIHFEMVRGGENLDRARLDAWQHIRSAENKVPPIIGSGIQVFELGIDASIDDGLVLEFGVRFGASIRQIAALAGQEVHGFDSFEGLPEAWHEEVEGSYGTGGKMPSVPDNVTLYNGWFEETLPGFVEKYRSPVRLVNIDCDIYSSTKTVLEHLAKQIVPGTILIFDEYIGNENWREDEFKAFQEAVVKFGWRYEYLCFSFMTKQVVVRIK